MSKLISKQHFKDRNDWDYAIRHWFKLRWRCEVFSKSCVSLIKGDNSSGEWLQFKLIASGVAAVFGNMYLYLYFYPSYAIPFLIFGASLKIWALAMV